MSEWVIRHSDGSVLKDENGNIVSTRSLEYSGSWMGECFVTVSFKNAAPILFKIGDYLTYRGEKFEINYDPGKIKQSRRNEHGEAFTYDNVKFNSKQDELARTEFLDIVLNDNEVHYTALTKFPFYVSSLDDLLDRIQANLDEQWGKAAWKLYSRNKLRSLQRGCNEEVWSQTYGEGVADNEIKSTSITVDGKTCWDALALVNQQFNVNFITRGRNVFVGTAGVPTSIIFRYGKGKGLYQIEQNADSEQSITTRLRAYGNTKNLPNRYYATLNLQVYASVTEATRTDVRNVISLKLDLDLPFSTLYFFNKLTDVSTEESPTYLVRVRCGEHVVNAKVSKNAENGHTSIIVESNPNATGADNNPDTDVLNSFAGLATAGARVYFTEGANKEQFPSVNKDYATDNLPNNMAVNHLMLPGFPNKSLKDWWDEQDEETKKRINPSGKQYNFSTNKYRPFVDSLNVSDIGVRPNSVYFDQENLETGLIDIYPTIEEMEVGGVRIDEVESADQIEDNGVFKDGQTVPNFHIYLKSSVNFDINEQIRNSTETPSISMKDGMCGGRDFEINSAKKQQDGRWLLTCKRVSDESLNLFFPYNDYQVKTGDHFVLTGIPLPDAYVESASVKLLKYALEFLNKNDYTRYVYAPKIDEIFMARQHDEAMADPTHKTVSIHDTIKEGEFMQFEDSDLDIRGSVTIDTLSIKEAEGAIPTYEVTLREDKSVGTIQKIQNRIDSLEGGNGGAGASATLPQVKNSLKTYFEDLFLSKTHDDSTPHSLGVGKDLTAGGIGTFLKGLKSKGDVVIGDFLHGWLGKGSRIDTAGNAEVQSLTVRDYLAVPELRFNRVTVSRGEWFNTSGYGTVERVDGDVVTIRLEEGEYGSFAVDDIVKGVFSSLGASADPEGTEDVKDACGMYCPRGFFSSYLTVAEIVENTAGRFRFRYTLRDGSPAPVKGMNLAQYGNWTDTSRQSCVHFNSTYRSYVETLDHVDQYELKPHMIVSRQGYLGDLTVNVRDGAGNLTEYNFATQSGDREITGTYLQKNTYTAGLVQLTPETYDDVVKRLKVYEVSLSSGSDSITVDCEGTCIGGLWTDEGGVKKYRLTTAVFASNRGTPLLLQTEDGRAAEGHYKVTVSGDGCSAFADHGTVYVSAIRHVKDGVAGTADDAETDYEAMRAMQGCRVQITVDVEGRGYRHLEYPVTIHHTDVAYISADLDNEADTVSYNAGTKAWVGLPVVTRATMWRDGKSALDITKTAVKVTGAGGTDVTSGVTLTAAGGRVSITALDRTKLGNGAYRVQITTTAMYAGVQYERTQVMTLAVTEQSVFGRLLLKQSQVHVSWTDGRAVADADRVYVDATVYDGSTVSLLSAKADARFALQWSADGSAWTVCPKDAEGWYVPVSATATNVYVRLTCMGVETDRETVPVVSDGKSGAKGVNGLNVADVKIYKRGASRPSVGTFRLKYTFSTHKLAVLPTENDMPAEGWYDTIPEGTGTLWCSIAHLSSREDTVTIEPGQWSTPGEVGSSGLDGINTAEVSIYSRSSAEPSSPKDAFGSLYVTYTFQDHTLHSSTDGKDITTYGWYDTVPVGTEPLWVARARVSARGAEAVISPTYWTRPVRLSGADGRPGDPGKPGTPGKSAYTHVVWARGDDVLTLRSRRSGYVDAQGERVETDRFWYQQGNDAFPLVLNGTPISGTYSWALQITAETEAPYGRSVTVELYSGTKRVWSRKVTGSGTISEVLAEPCPDTPTVRISTDSDASVVKTLHVRVMRDFNTEGHGEMRGEYTSDSEPTPLGVGDMPLYRWTWLVGDTGLTYYPAGTWDGKTVYLRDNAVPIVKAGDTYYYLTADRSTGEPPATTPSSWQRFSMFKAIYTDVLFAEFAKLGSFAVNGDWFISTKGTAGRNGAETEQYGTFEPGNMSPDYGGSGFVPYLAIDARSGAIYARKASIEGHISATSGDIGGVQIMDMPKEINLSPRYQAFISKSGIAYTSNDNGRKSYITPVNLYPKEIGSVFAKYGEGLSYVEGEGYSHNMPMHSAYVRIMSDMSGVTEKGIGYATNARVIGSWFETTNGARGLHVYAYGKIYKDGTNFIQYQAPGWNVNSQRMGTGYYKVTYGNTVYQDIYTVFLQGVMTNGLYIKVSLEDKQSAYFTARTSDDYTPDDGDFEFLVLGMGMSW